VGCLEAKIAENKSMNYSIRSSEEAEGRALSALVTGPQRVTIDSAEKKALAASIPVPKQPADEIPVPVLVPQTFRLPQRLIEDLVRAGELRALSWLDREGNIWLPISSKPTLP
jgi:hypothetical protein